MTYHQQKGRGYGYVTVLKFCLCRDEARRAGLSATAELLVNFSLHGRSSTFPIVTSSFPIFRDDINTELIFNNILNNKSEN